MKLLSAIRFTVTSLLGRRRADRELDEELAYHLDRETARYEELGMSAGAARREALKQFGGIERYREECRDVRRTRWLDDARQDVRLTFRLVRQRPVFAGSVIAITAIAIAACVATFSIVNGTLLVPLPFDEPDRVTSLQLESVEGTSGAIPAETYHRIATASSRLFEAIGSGVPGNTVLTVDGEPKQVRTEAITSSLLRVYGIAPLLGRGFSEDEVTQQAHVALLGYTVWVTRFGADSGIIGQAVVLDGVSHTVIGVMPARFRSHRAEEPAVWLPRRVPPPGEPGATTNALVRLAPGVTRGRAEAWLASMGRVAMASVVRTDSVVARPILVPVSDLILGNVRRPMRVLLGAVLLVLALATANVGTLLLARWTSRGHELALRRALGASAGRETRYLMTESGVLALVGGSIGVLAAVWLVSAARTLGREILPRPEAVSMDWRVALFALTAVLAAGMAAGLVPAMVARRRPVVLGPTTSRVTTRVHGASGGLVVLQIALSVMLVIGAGLLMKGFLHVLPDEPGFALENRATVTVRLRGRAAFRTDTPAERRFVHDVIRRMSDVAGVREVAATTYLPFIRMFALSEIEIPGVRHEGKPFTAFRSTVTPNYLGLMRIPIVAGRGFSETDIEGAERVAVINQTAAARWWPGQNPVGRRLTYTERRERTSATVVGVTRDARLSGTDTQVRPELYVPVAQGSIGMVSFIARTDGAGRANARDLERTVWSVAPDLPIESTTDLATIARESVGPARFYSATMSAFAGVAVALTTLGVYGLLAFMVAARRREIGIRLALGAPRPAVGRMVVRRSLTLGIGGVVAGTLGARALTRHLESLLLEVGPTDPAVFIGTGVGVLLVAIGASLAPAVQAIRVDPMTVIHAE